MQAVIDALKESEARLRFHGLQGIADGGLREAKVLSGRDRRPVQHEGAQNLELTQSHYHPNE
jgi:hypothetical protein